MLGIEIMKRLGSSASGGLNLLSAHYKSFNDALLWKVDNDGFTYTKKDTTFPYVQFSAWIIPQVGMSSYDIMATLLSGEIPQHGTLGSWENLGTDRIWGWDDGDLHECELSVKIRLTSSGAVVDTATIKLTITEVFEP